MKGTESNWSYASYDNLPDVLRKCDPSSLVFKNITMGRKKVSYIVSHGLGPFFQKQLTMDIRKAEAFTVGIDGATFKFNGLEKHVDIRVRYWSEEIERVRDVYLDTHTFGREPAVKQVAAVKDSLQSSCLDPKKLIMLSRDDPNVMKTVHRLLSEWTKSEGNDMMFSGPCSLHPAHTAYKLASEDLEVDILHLLRLLHSWFKLSTARREDMKKIEELLNSIDGFFLRLIVTRWLCAEPALERFLALQETAVEYFITFLPMSEDQCNKKAVKSPKYQEIRAYLTPLKLPLTEIYARFNLFLCQMSHNFLVIFQSERPQIHRLFPESFNLVLKFAKLIVRTEKLPTSGKDLKQLQVLDSNILKPLNECDFGPGVKNLLPKLRDDDQRKAVKKDFKKAIQSEIQYLQKHLPLDRPIVTKLKYLSPKLRKDQNMKSQLVGAAKIMKRFNQEELDQLNIEILSYEMIDEDKVPKFNDTEDSLDAWWNQVFTLLDDQLGGEAKQVRLLIKMSLVLAHGNAFLERGFSDTKKLSHGRESLSLPSIKGQKYVTDKVRHHGGPQNVPINSALINSVKMSRMEYNAAKEKEKKDEEERKKTEKEKEETRKKRQKEEDAMMSWDRKKEDFEDQLVQFQGVIKKYEKVQQDCLKVASNSKKKNEIQETVTAASSAMETVQKYNTKLWQVQEEIKRHIGKKPRFK